MDYFAEGSPAAALDAHFPQFVDRLLAGLERRAPLKRVLILPPDVTRLHSAAGPLTTLLYDRLKDRAEVVILPALGTHAPMDADELAHMFPGVPAAAFRPHDWRNGVVPVGEVPAALIRELSEGK